MKKGIKGMLVISLATVLAFSLVAIGCPPPREQVVPEQVVPVVPQELTVAVATCRAGARWVFMGGISPYDTAGIFETLLYLAPDFTVHPGLATSWELIDETTWRFQLRQGVRFHSGRPFNAEAAKSALDALLKNEPAFMSAIFRVASVTVVDEYTIDIHTTMPFASVAEIATHPLVVMANQEQEGEIVPDGTGPFKYYSHVVGVDLVVVANEDYWGGRPKLDRIVFKVIPDAMTRFLALRAGEIDVYRTVALADVPILEADPGITVHRVVTSMVQRPQFHLHREPTNEVLVRRAIAHAIDNKGIVDVILGGMGAVATSFIIPQMPWSIYAETEGFPYDPEKARRLLAEAGWKDTDRDGIVDRDGKPLSLDMIFTVVIPETLPMAEMIQGSLREIGIDLQLRVLEPGLFHETLNAGAYDIAFGRNIIASAYGEILLDLAHRRARANRDVLTTWISEEVDALIDKGAGTFDREERYEINRQIQRIFEEVVLFAPMHYPEAADATGAHVRGFVMHISPWSQRWDRVYIVR